MSARYDFVALRRLNHSVRQCRRLSMTGPATYPSKLLTAKTLSARPEMETAAAYVERQTQSGRTFNTSRQLKRNKDSSTVDFTFMPDMEAGRTETGMRLPRFDVSSAQTIKASAEDSSTARVVKPEISTTSPDIQLSPMSEVHDNNAVHIDYHTVAEQVEKAASRASQPRHSTTAIGVTSKRGTLGALWSGIVDDLKGRSSSMPASSATA